MWRLFPKFWFTGKNTISALQSEVVNVFHKHWLSWLSKALCRILKKDISADAAAAELAKLNAKHLLALDQALRFGMWSQDLGRPARGTNPLVLLEGHREDIEAYLFTAACDSNGFVREQALVSFRQFPGRLATAAALIRSDDWVKEVRVQAENLLDHIINSSGGAEFFDFMDLLLVLKDRERFAKESWLPLIEPTLRKPEFSEARWQATRTGSAKSRLFNYSMIAQINPELLLDICQQAVWDADPAIARWAMTHCSPLPQTNVLTILKLALRHPHASVRAEAIRQCAAIDKDGSLEMLTQALFDPARAPRNAAAYLLRTGFQIDAGEFWRNCLDTESGRRTTIALLALADVATSEDVERLMPWQTHPKGAIRTATFRGLIKTKAGDTKAIINTALMDESTMLIRQVIAVWKADPTLITRTQLEAAFVNAKNDRTKASLISASFILGKWHSLELLLAWHSSATANIQALNKQELQYWVWNQHHQFTRLDPATSLSINALLSNLKVTCPSDFWMQFDHVISHA